MSEPSNAVLAEKIDALSNVVERIETQVCKTNGRVTKLETYKSMVIGALLILNVFAVPMVLNLINKWMNK